MEEMTLMLMLMLWFCVVRVCVWRRRVQVFGRKKNAVAVSFCKQGKGVIKINGSPLHLVEPQILRIKAAEPILLLGRERFANVDIRVRVKGGGYTSQIYGAFVVGGVDVCVGDQF